MNPLDEAQETDIRAQKSLALALRRGLFKAASEHARRLAMKNKKIRTVYRISVQSDFWIPKKSEKSIRNRMLGAVTIARTLDGDVLVSTQMDPLD